MKLSLIVLSGTVAISLSGCAMASKIYTSDGREGFNIDCSGSALSWGSATKKLASYVGLVATTYSKSQAIKAALSQLISLDSMVG
ncbi:hypothetical protein [Pseudomonas mohnii]